MPTETLPNSTDVEEGPAMPHVERSMACVCTILHQTQVAQMTAHRRQSPAYVLQVCFVVQRVGGLHSTAAVLQTSRLTQGTCVSPVPLPPYKQ